MSTTGVVIEIDTKTPSIHMFDSSTRKPIYSFAMAKDYTRYIPSASAVGDSKPCARPETTKTNRPRGYFAPITATSHASTASCSIDGSCTPGRRRR